MGKVNDYINSLDGQEHLTVEEVAGKLLELHNEEISIRESKIASLETEKDGLATTVAEKDGEITRVKAMNWDLVNQLPKEGDNEGESENPGGNEINQKLITLDDAFTQ